MSFTQLVSVSYDDDGDGDGDDDGSNHVIYYIVRGRFIIIVSIQILFSLCFKTLKMV